MLGPVSFVFGTLLALWKSAGCGWPVPSHPVTERAMPPCQNGSFAQSGLRTRSHGDFLLPRLLSSPPECPREQMVAWGIDWVPANVGNFFWGNAFMIGNACSSQFLFGCPLG